MKNWLNQDLAVGDYVVTHFDRGSTYVGEIAALKLDRNGAPKARIISRFHTSGTDSKVWEDTEWHRQPDGQYIQTTPNTKVGGWMYVWKATKIDKATFDNVVPV